MFVHMLMCEWGQPWQSFPGNTIPFVCFLRQGLTGLELSTRPTSKVWGLLVAVTAMLALQIRSTMPFIFNAGSGRSSPTNT